MIDRRKYIKDTYLRGINKYKHYFFEDKKNNTNKDLTYWSYTIN